MSEGEVRFFMDSSVSLQRERVSVPTAAAASQKPLDLMWVSHIKSQDVTLTGDSSTHIAYFHMQKAEIKAINSPFPFFLG